MREMRAEDAARSASARVLAEAVLPQLRETIAMRGNPLP
jgi:hypothetical protein